ncbi:MAG: MFS transporter [Terracidiphilus sp.]|nr:MFS transporter [Terracidiphilus sp.]
MSRLESSTDTSSAPSLLSARRCWYLTALIGVVALVNYFDRQSLSVVAPRFQEELHLSDAGYGHVVSLFLFASAIAYALAGFIADWLGTRASMALFVGWWSAAEAATAFVRSTLQLGMARFCLGLGEPGMWVAAPKAIGEIFPQKDRSLAIGVYTLGSTVGAVAALPTIAAITSHLPWKSIFLLDGCAGLLWLPFWLLAYPGRRQLRQLVPQPAAIAPPQSQLALVKELLSRSKTWKLVVARGITDPVWYFYLFWFPKYMLSARGMTLAEVARTGWLVYLLAGVGTVLGGALSGILIRRGLTPASAYRATMFLCALLVPLSPLAATVHSALAGVCIASVIAMAHMAWLVNLSSTIVELFPSHQVGKAFGIVAAGSGFGGMVSTEVIGSVVTHCGYTPLFFLMMALHPIALAILWKVFKQDAVA